MAAAEDKDLDRDRVSEEPELHPAGTGRGTIGDAVAGAAGAILDRPADTAAGGVADAVVGSMAGKAAASGVNRVESTEQRGGAAQAVDAVHSASDDSGDTRDVIATLNDLIECCKDGEYGFRACAEQVKRQDLQSAFLQCADDCRGAAQELSEQIRDLGGKAGEGGSVAGAIHRGWVSLKSTLGAYDDKAVLEECERGEDAAVARYRKALKEPLFATVKLIVERQLQGVQRNHDQIKMLRDQLRAAT